MKADLQGANLVDANLQGANLQGARLMNARYSTETKWPDGFDPIAAEAKKVDDNTSADDNYDDGYYE